MSIDDILNTNIGDNTLRKLLNLNNEELQGSIEDIYMWILNLMFDPKPKHASNFQEFGVYTIYFIIILTYNETIKLKLWRISL